MEYSSERYSAPMLTGVDLGGTKIEAIVLDDHDHVVAKQRIATPRGDYAATVSSIATLVANVEEEAGGGGDCVGIGVPGSPSPRSGIMRNCNSTVLNGRPLRTDLETAMRRTVRLANDANCLALSEAHDGAAVGADTVFAIILGTGVGGGVIVDGHLVEGRNGVAGEWGHMPLPWPDPLEHAAHTCWCGRTNCLETWLSGPALEQAWITAGHDPLPATVLAAQSPTAPEVLAWIDRLARATAVLIDVFDPDIFVVGGGLNAIEAIYREVPRRWPDHVFADAVETRIQPAAHGDASGARGAARLPTRPAR